MIEKYKKDFSELLKKIETVGIDQSPSCNKELDKFFRNVENDYRKNQSGLFAKIENLKITSDILDHKHGGRNIEKPNDNPLKLATDKAIGKISNYVFFEMRERLIPFNLKIGKWLFGQGRIEETLDAWEEILKVNPDNEYIHSKLLEMMDTGPVTNDRAEELHRRYQFKYIGSFGYGIVETPVAIITADHEDIVLVADRIRCKIYPRLCVNKDEVLLLTIVPRI